MSHLHLSSLICHVIENIKKLILSCLQTNMVNRRYKVIMDHQQNCSWVNLSNEANYYLFIFQLEQNLLERWIREKQEMLQKSQGRHAVACSLASFLMHALLMQPPWL